MNISEAELIKRAQTGSADAFCLLATRYQRRVYALALHFCRHRQDAEDLSQEVWLRAFRAINSFRGDASFYTWLRQIMINTFLNYQREHQVKTDGENIAIKLASLDQQSETDSLLARQHSPDRLDQQMLLASVAAALKDLSEQERLIFLLKHREGMTYEEIAVALDCSAGTIKKSLFRALDKLRRQLGLKAPSNDCQMIGDWQ